MRITSYVVLITVFLAPLAAGCALVSRLPAYFKSTDMFHPVGENVLIEADEDSAWGEQIQSVIPQYLDSVQNKVGLDFTQEVKVFVCHSTESFCDHTGSKSPGPRASVLRKFFVSPRLQGTEDWSSIVYHELVHVLLMQNLSMYRYLTTPIWFHEGLATMVANGGGSGNINDSTAIANILDGKHFNPVDKENFVFPQSFENPDIGIWVHYRQAMLFVAYMKTSNPQSFDTLMHDLVSGMNFREAVHDAYGEDVASLWTMFTEDIHENPIQSGASPSAYIGTSRLRSFN